MSSAQLVRTSVKWNHMGLCYIRKCRYPFFFFALRLTDSSLFFFFFHATLEFTFDGRTFIAGGGAWTWRPPKNKKVEKEEVYALWLYTPRKRSIRWFAHLDVSLFDFSCKKLFWKKTKKAKLCFSSFFIFCRVVCTLYETAMALVRLLLASPLAYSSRPSGGTNQ